MELVNSRKGRLIENRSSFAIEILESLVMKEEKWIDPK
jgi:hypothetical protein